MKGKILFLAGLGVGYVLGTRAGRQRYEQIKAAASNLWQQPMVQRSVDDVQEFVKDKAPEVAEFVADGAKKVVAQVAGRSGGSKSTSKTPAKSASAAKSTTAGKSSSTTKKSSSSASS